MSDLNRKSLDSSMGRISIHINEAEEQFYDILSGKPYQSTEDLLAKKEQRTNIVKQAVDDRMFLSIDVYPIKYYDLFQSMYPGWEAWVSETIKETIKRNFAQTPVPEVMDKLAAIQTLMNTSKFWLEWNVFEKCANAFNGKIVLFGQYQPLNVSECTLAIQVAKEIDAGEKYSDEVNKYIAVCAHDSGWLRLPEELSFAQQDLNDLVGPFYNLVVGVSNKWNASKDKDPLALNFKPDNIIDMQLLKLFAVKEYLKTRKGL